MQVKNYWPLLKTSFSKFLEDNAPRLGAALAYYTVLSLAPLLIVVIAIVALAFGREAAQGQIVSQLSGLVGSDGGQAIQTMVKGAQKPSTGIIATILGLITLLLGASGVFTELRGALNTIWNVKAPSSSGILGMVRERFFSFGMVLAIGFLLLVSLAVSAFLAGLGKFFGGVLPDVKLRWSDVWTGAAVTALLFSIGKLLIGIYLGKASVGSAYGAAGSFVVVLVWIYYSAQIFLFGAEFTHVYGREHGSMMQPAAERHPEPQPKTPVKPPARDPEPVTGTVSVVLGSALVAVKLFRSRVL